MYVNAESRQIWVLCAVGGLIAGFLGERADATYMSRPALPAGAALFGGCKASAVNETCDCHTGDSKLSEEPASVARKLMAAHVENLCGFAQAIRRFNQIDFSTRDEFVSAFRPVVDALRACNTAYVNLSRARPTLTAAILGDPRSTRHDLDLIDGFDEAERFKWNDERETTNSLLVNAVRVWESIDAVTALNQIKEQHRPTQTRFAHTWPELESLLWRELPYLSRAAGRECR